MNLFSYFVDPILRGPTLGCMFMCLSAALVGVIVFLRKQCLLGESLSHAAYPGVLLAVFVFSMIFPKQSSDEILSLFILVGALFSTYLGWKLIQFLEKTPYVNTDAALCFVLSVFFGIGVTMASRLQFTHTNLYKQAQRYLYGQAATMGDSHILIYGILSLLVLSVIVLFYKEIQVMNFDRDYAASLGLRLQILEGILTFLTLAAIIIGIRSVGVVMMSSMLIAPAASARQFTDKLYKMFLLAALFSLLSGFLGVYASVELSEYFQNLRGSSVTIPTGPMVVLVAVSICFFSLFFAPNRGVLLRVWRIFSFKLRCLEENILKAIWRSSQREATSFSSLQEIIQAPAFLVRFMLRSLVRDGWLYHGAKDSYGLTEDGLKKAAHIVRLHRLWEVYLVQSLGFGVERVHKSAEEMEHIITPELEKKLAYLLDDPKLDPHLQPIPSSEGKVQ